jgi:hypothetical protein
MPFRLWLGVLAVAACPLRLQAQVELAPAWITISGGVQRYRTSELTPRRSGALAALRLASPLVPLGIEHWLVEGGLSYGWYRADDGDLRHLFIPELQLQWQFAAGVVHPYVGVGGGLGFTRGGSTKQFLVTGSASGGVRFLFDGSWNMMFEGRLRRINVFRGVTPELTVGLVGRVY